MILSAIMTIDMAITTAWVVTFPTPSAPSFTLKPKKLTSKNNQNGKGHTF